MSKAMSEALALRKRDLLDIYNHAVAAIKPDELVKNTLNITKSPIEPYTHVLAFAPPKQITRLYKLADFNLHVIGGGKSALAMACGLAQQTKGATSLFSSGLLSLPVGLRDNFEANPKLHDLLKTIGISCLFGSENNLPDENSVLASRSILELVKSACDKAKVEKRRPLFIVLISGGGSACLTSPKYIDLEKKLNLIKFLVQRGATIVELNKVRRYFSNVKGGRLASYILSCHPQSEILALIMSDVIGDPIEFIASGPTHIASNHEDYRQQMLNVLVKYGYNVGELLEGVNERDGPPIDFSSICVVNYIIGNNSNALDAAMDRAKLLGYQVENMGSTLQGFSEKLVEAMIDRGSRTSKDTSENFLVIGGGEATINKRQGETWGIGGRAQEMALDYMIDKISNEIPERDSRLLDVFLAGGTDGQDGPTDVAACMASFAEWKSQKGLFSLTETLEAKRAHDSYDFWSKHKPDWLVKTGLTGTNVMDLYMILVSNK